MPLFYLLPAWNLADALSNTEISPTIFMTATDANGDHFGVGQSSYLGSGVAQHVGVPFNGCVFGGGTSGDGVFTFAY